MLTRGPGRGLCGRGRGGGRDRRPGRGRLRDVVDEVVLALHGAELLVARVAAGPSAEELNGKVIE